MVETTPKPGAGVMAALEAGDAVLAQSRLDAATDLPERRRMVLQAQIMTARGEAAGAVALLEGFMAEVPAGRQALATLARARLEAGDPSGALAELDKRKDGTDTPDEARIRIAALAATGDAAATEAAIAAAQAAGPGKLPLALVVSALCQVGRLETAAVLFTAKEPSKSANPAASAAFVAACLRNGRADLLHGAMPVLARTAGLPWAQTLAAGYRKLTDPHQRSAAIDTLETLIATEGRAHLAYRLANALLQTGDEEGGQRLIARFSAMTAAAPGTADAHGAAELLGEVPLDALAEWLDIPAGERDAWRAELERMAPEIAMQEYALAADPAYLATVRAAMTPADLAPLKALNRDGKPGLVAHMHAGLLMGTIIYHHDAGVSSWLLGGAPMMQKLLPGGGQLHPIPRGEPLSRSVRRIIEQLDAGHLVGLAADGNRGTLSEPIRHHGMTFRLPDSIPQLAFRRGIPVYLMAAHWRDGRIVCDCLPAPAPEPGESFEPYRDRWFTFLLDHMRAICQADPRNIPFGQGVFRGARRA